MADSKDLFYLDKVFPEADKIFSESFKSPKQVFDDCLIVLDTNILLVLFDTNEKSVSDVKSIYLNYKKDGRLFIPARVSREFANNRAGKIAEIFLQIRQTKENLNNFGFKISQYPILENSQDYKDLGQSFSSIRDLIKNSRKSLENIENQIQSWTWNDSVSTAYKEIFTPEIIVEVKTSQKDLEKDLAFRIEYKVAPGYRDSKKSDEGIGDLIIWYTLMELAKDKKRDLLFVTNDQKNDWFYKQDKIGLYPKYELFDEFRRFTDGKSVSIINFIEFLEMAKANKETIQEVKTTISENLVIESINIGMAGLTEGVRVEHPKFGQGVVLEVLSVGKNQTARVNFDEYGEKLLLVRYAGLKILKQDKCLHEVTMVYNGIYNEYKCIKCGQTLYRQISEEVS